MDITKLNKKKVLSLVVTIVILLIFVYWFKSISFDYNKALIALSNINLYYLLIAVLINIAIFFVKIFRLQQILSFYNFKLSIGQILPAHLLGRFAANVTPMKVGEPVKALLLKKKYGVPLTFGIGANIVERILDLLLIVLSFLFSIVFIKYGLESKLVWIVLTIVVLAYLFMNFGIAHKYIRNPMLSFLKLLARKLKKKLFKKLVIAFRKYIKELRKKTTFERIFVSIYWFCITALIMILEVSTIYILFKALGVNMGFMHVTFTLMFASLLGFVSQTPGGAVTVEGVSTYFFTMFGATPEIGLSAILLARLMGSYLIMIIGFLFALKERKNIL